MKLEIEVFHHFVGVDVLTKLYERLDKVMATLDQVLTEVTNESTRLDSIGALIDGLKKQVADALSGANLPPATQAKIDAVFVGLTANKVKIDTALNVGVPPAVVPPVV